MKKLSVFVGYFLCIIIYYSIIVELLKKFFDGYIVNVGFIVSLVGFVDNDIVMVRRKFIRIEYNDFKLVLFLFIKELVRKIIDIGIYWYYICLW